MTGSSPKSSAWEGHPGVRSGEDLTLGERAADGMRNGLGTWTFLAVFTALMLAWISTGGFGVDHSPYFRLNLALSCLAGLQGAIILIAQKRSDRVSAEHALHHYEETKLLHRLLEENTILTREIADLRRANPWIHDGPQCESRPPQSMVEGPPGRPNVDLG